jgi:ABC-type nitrate/sulfonate/bicarbonate transport system substrate-binding protein
MKFHRLFAVLAVLALSAPVPGGAQTTLTPLRMSINPHFITYTPFFVAMDKGYFKDAGLDIQFTKYTTSANSQLPSLAKATSTSRSSSRARRSSISSIKASMRA